MAEIKSTLDIVMQKTSHLKLSEQERQKQKLKDIQGNINGLIQKYKDGLLKEEQIKRQWKAIKQRHVLSGDSLLIKESLQQLGLDQENQPLIYLLAEICHIDTRGITAVLETYQTTQKDALERLRQSAKESLAQERSISGSAVVPNLEHDLEWTDQKQKIETAHEALLEQLRQSVLSSG